MNKVYNRHCSWLNLSKDRQRMEHSFNLSLTPINSKPDSHVLLQRTLALAHGYRQDGSAHSDISYTLPIVRLYLINRGRFPSAGIWTDILWMISVRATSQPENYTLSTTYAYISVWLHYPKSATIQVRMSYNSTYTHPTLNSRSATLTHTSDQH